MDIDDLIEQIKMVSKNYGKKFNIIQDDDWYVLKLQEELGELTQSYLMMIKSARTKGKTEEEIKDDFENEVADLLGMTLLLANHFNVDIKKKMEEKWLKWNK